MAGDGGDRYGLVRIGMQRSVVTCINQSVTRRTPPRLRRLVMTGLPIIATPPARLSSAMHVGPAAYIVLRGGPYINHIYQRDHMSEDCFACD